MAGSAPLNHRIPTHRFLIQSLTPPPTLVTFKLIASETRFRPLLPPLSSIPTNPLYPPQKCKYHITPCLNSSSSSSSSSSAPKIRFNPSTRLYVSGLSFRTTEESLRNAFKNFGKLTEVNLVMDRIANRPRGFAFLTYTTVEESQKAIEGMHGKFLDGRVIFVENAKSGAELRQERKQSPGRAV